MTTPESPDSVNATPPTGQPDVVLDIAVVVENLPGLLARIADGGDSDLIAAGGESRAALATSPRWSGTTASGRLPGSD